MNYIKQLELEKIHLQGQLRAVKDEIYSFREHLSSPKFQGTDPDGDRRDWISTQDVLNRLSEIANALYE